MGLVIGGWLTAGLWAHACSLLSVFSTCNIFRHRLQTASPSMRRPPAQMLPSERVDYLYFRHGGLPLVFAVFSASVGSGRVSVTLGPLASSQAGTENPAIMETGGYGLRSSKAWATQGPPCQWLWFQPWSVLGHHGGSIVSKDKEF